MTADAVDARYRARTSRLRARRIASAFGVGLAGACATAAAFALLVILGYIVVKGIHALNVPLLTSLPRPVGVTGGGVANGIVGSAIVVVLATLIAIPIGVLSGVYLALFGRGPFAETVRFLSDVMSGVPSIAIGLFAYVLLVAPFKHFSGVSAAFALAVLMLPTLIRTSEEAVRSVPRTLMEGALALGMTASRSTLRIVLPVARPGIVTGLLLGIARIAGETAPLLFTAFGTQFWEFNPTNPIAVLPLQIFTYATSPYEDWRSQAWGGALVLVVAVLALNIGARLVLSRATRR
jgi:phosphate transport system permease protein